MKNIVLIGMMGTYKTSAGKIIAKKTGLSFIDTDAMLVERFKISISDFFKLYGEQEFREQESELIEELSDTDNTVIATGGGVIKRISNIEFLQKNGIIINITASAKYIYERVKTSQTRPLLKSFDPLKKIEDLLAERERIYRQYAEAVIDSDGLTSIQTADKIIDFLNEKKLLQNN